MFSQWGRWAGGGWGEGGREEVGERLRKVGRGGKREREHGVLNWPSGTSLGLPFPQLS